MKKLTRLELVIINAALLYDKYEYDYMFENYKKNIGISELHRVRNVNDIIYFISNNSSEFLEIVKQLNDDIEYITFNMKETGSTQNINQLNDAYEILKLLQQSS